MKRKNHIYRSKDGSKMKQSIGEINSPNELGPRSNRIGTKNN